MLPQKIALDVLLDENDHEVTVEVNGTASGYNGMIGTNDDPTDKITDIFGKAFRNKRVAYPWNHFEFSSQFNKRIRTLRKKYNTHIEERSLLYPETEYDNYFGFSKINSNGIDDYHMINSIALEEITKHKLLQYELLKGIPDLRMPTTDWALMFDFNNQYFDSLFETNKLIVEKKPDSLCGFGIFTHTKDQFYQKIEEKKSIFTKAIN